MTQTALSREQVITMEVRPKLDALVAQHVMGWHKGDSWGGMYWEDSDKCCRYEILVFKPSLHTSMAWRVEERIVELRLQAKYCVALKQVVIGTGEYVGMFDYIHATPAQRCKAALLAVLDI
ncbi:BC1872 family protein [Paenibacillus amylolyticus]|uniref:BC1872 family protein n=1 Tax=Paenibacillus amylolyticus TaxID=1451 RepID=UPI003D95D47C